jgi:hypothetical protein
MNPKAHELIGSQRPGTRRWRTRAAWVLLMLFSAATGQAQDLHFPSYEAYVDFLRSYPYDVSADWTDNVQGLTHDDSHWFITQDKVLTKVPLSLSLDGNVKNKAGVLTTSLTSIPSLINGTCHDGSSPGNACTSDGDCPPLLGPWPNFAVIEKGECGNWHHFGDISYYSHEGEGYVLAPVDSHPAGCPQLAIFRASNLQFIRHVCIPGQLSTSGSGQAGWLAVDSRGLLYSSTNTATSIRTYALNWDNIETTAAPVLSGEIPLMNAQGAGKELRSMQGGVVSPERQVLYLSNGWEDCGNSSYGLHAFDISGGSNHGRQIIEGCQGSCLFQFKFDSCVEILPGSLELNEEPEGMTIWDLEEQGPNNIRGQLHVLLLNNSGANDNVFFKHYSSSLYVDGAASSGDGEYDTPFNDLADTFSAALSGMTIVIRDGTYSGSQLIDQKVRLKAGGSSAILGAN